MRTRAAVFTAPNEPLDIRELDVADPGPGEVLVRLVASGVCHSDYHVVKGDWGVEAPVVLGHEGAGVVERVGPGVTSVADGDHVILSWVPYCGECYDCAAGKPALCQKVQDTAYNGLMLDGTTRLSDGDHEVYSYCATASFSEYSVVPETGVVKIRRDAPLDRAALIGCAVTTGVGAVINTADVRPGQTVLIIGCGGVGLSAVMGARLLSAGTIIAADLHDGALEKARQLGATHTVNTGTEDLTDAVARIAGSHGVDWAFEAIGLKPTIEQAFELVRPGGTAVVIGQAAEGVTIEIDPFVMSDREKSLIGSSYGSASPAIDFPRLVELYMNGRLDLDVLVARTAPLEQINEAFAAMGRGEAARTVLTF